LGGVYYPMPSPEREESILSALEEIDPDAVLIHTLGSQVLSEVEEISKRWPTCLRLGTNYLEFWLTEYRNRIDNILWAIDHVDAVIAPSERVKENLEVMGLRNAVVIPTAIDFDSWELSDGESNTVVTISRMDPIKCHITPVLALKKLGKRIPHLKYKIYGEGGLGRLLDRLLKVLGADWISPEGFRPAKEVLPEARVFVQASISENCSLSTLEALASGVPCVCSDTAGHPDSSVKVSHEDLKGFVREVERLLTDEDYWERKREEGLEEAKEHDLSKIMPRYESLFSTLLELDDFKRESGVLEAVER